MVFREVIADIVEIIVAYPKRSNECMHEYAGSQVTITDGESSKIDAN